MMEEKGMAILWLADLAGTLIAVVFAIIMALALVHNFGMSNNWVMLIGFGMVFWGERMKTPDVQRTVNAYKLRIYGAGLIIGGGLMHLGVESARLLP